MEPKEVEQSLMGIVQELEPMLPTRPPRGQKKVSLHPVTGEPLLERMHTSKNKKEKKPKVRESKEQKRTAKERAFWDSLI